MSFCIFEPIECGTKNWIMIWEKGTQIRNLISTFSSIHFAIISRYLLQANDINVTHTLDYISHSP